MELITPAYSYTQLAIDTFQLAFVAGISYVLGYNLAFRFLLWWHQRQRN
jgi:hypothetical protein